MNAVIQRILYLWTGSAWCRLSKVLILHSVFSTERTRVPSLRLCLFAALNLSIIVLGEHKISPQPQMIFAICHVVEDYSI